MVSLSALPELVGFNVLYNANSENTWASSDICRGFHEMQKDQIASNKMKSCDDGFSLLRLENIYFASLHSAEGEKITFGD